MTENINTVNSLIDENINKDTLIKIMTENQDEKCSVNSNQNLIINLNNQKYQYLKGYIISDKNCIPGTFFIDNILKLYPLQDLSIDVEFSNFPLVINEEGECQVKSNIFKMDNFETTEFKCEFHFQQISCENNNSFGENAKPATINFKLSKLEYTVDKLEVDELISQCNLTTVSWNDFYPFLSNKFGLGYQGIFQNTVECFIGENCSFSEVSLELLYGFHDQESFFNASILDVCLHGTYNFIAEEQGQIKLEKIEGFKYYSCNVPTDRNDYSSVFVYSKLISRIGNSYCSSVTIMLEDGTILIEIDNLVLTIVSETSNDPLEIIYPNDMLYTPYLQSKDSLIGTPSSFATIHLQDEFSCIQFKDNITECQKYISSSLFKIINERCPELTMEIINSMSVEELKQKYCTNLNHERLFNYVFETIKKFGDVSTTNHWNESDILDELVPRAIRINAKTLFPLENDDEITDTPRSLTECGLLKNLYTNEHLQSSLMVAETIKQIIKPLETERMVFRIIEFGGGIGTLSVLVVDKINELINENPNLEVDIEYTWSDVYTSAVHFGKSILSHLNKRVNIVYGVYDLNEPLVDVQSLKPSYYDLVLVSNTFYLVKDISFSLNQIYKILTPNGHLFILEPPYKSTIHDCIFGVFNEWWSFETNEIRSNRCNLPQSTWKKLLVDCNFSQDILISKEFDYSSFTIQAQKPSLILQKQQPPKYFDQIIIYGSNESVCKLIENHYNQKQSTSKIHFINSIDEFNDLSSLISNESIIYFIKSMDQLDIDNFKSITFEYIQINQKLIELKSNCKHALFTYESQEINYLASSLIGAARYFDEIPQLQLLTIDFDNKSFGNAGGSSDESITMVLNLLIDNGKNTNSQVEYFIRNGLVYFEIFKKESKYQNIAQNSHYQIDSNYLGKTVLVTGQSGVILKVLKWIIRYSSIENVIILSRSPIKWEMELLMNKNKQINFIFKSVDVGDTEQVNESLDEIFNENQSITNIDSIFHFAFSPITRKPTEIDIDSLDISHGAKTMGAINLHNQSIQRSWKLINFIMASSVNSTIGCLLDQCSYISSNCVLNSFSKYRRSLELTSNCLNFGPIGGTGFISRNKPMQFKLVNQGLNLLSINQVLGSLDLQIKNQSSTSISSSNLMICNFNFPVFKKYTQTIHQKFDYNFNYISTMSSFSGVSNFPPTSVKYMLANKISELLLIDPSKLNLDFKLTDYGADSILIVQLRNFANKEYTPNLMTIKEIQTNSISWIFQVIEDFLENQKNESN